MKKGGDRHPHYGEVSGDKSHVHKCPGCHHLIWHSHGNAPHWHNYICIGKGKALSFCPNCVKMKGNTIEDSQLFQDLINQKQFHVPHSITLPKDEHWRGVCSLIEPPRFEENVTQKFHKNYKLRGVNLIGLVRDEPFYHPSSWASHALNEIRARYERFQPLRRPFNVQFMTFFENLDPSFFFDYYGWDQHLLPSDVVSTYQFRKKFPSNRNRAFLQALEKLSSHLDAPKNTAKLMVKHDEQLFRTVNDKDKQARALCNMNTELLVHQGALGNTLENFWRRTMNSNSYIFMTSGAMNYEITYFLQKMIYVLSGDVSGMDSSYIEVVLFKLIDIAIHPLENKDYWRPILRRKANLVIYNQEFPRNYYYKFQNDGRLPTGDNMTLLLNCLFCMVLVTFVSLRLGKKIYATIQGDDHALQDFPGLEDIYCDVCEDFGLKTTYEKDHWYFIEYCSLICYKTIPYTIEIRHRLDERIIYEPIRLEHIHDWKPITALKSLVYSTDNPVLLEDYIPQLLKSLSFHSSVPIFRDIYIDLKNKFGVADQLATWFLRLNRHQEFKHQHTVNWQIDPAWENNLKSIRGDLFDAEIFDLGFENMKKLIDVRKEQIITEIQNQPRKRVQKVVRRKKREMKLQLALDVEHYIDSQIY